MSNYTPWPWIESEPSFGDSLPRYTTENEANARLISAAPEMYELLEMIANTIEYGGRLVSFMDDDIESINEVLSKVRNETI